MKKIKKLSNMQRVAILISSLIIAAGVLIFSQMYFSHAEAKAAVDGCYDKDGFPAIEKTGFSIESFECNFQ